MKLNFHNDPQIEVDETEELFECQLTKEWLPIRDLVLVPLHKDMDIPKVFVKYELESKWFDKMIENNINP